MSTLPFCLVTVLWLQNWKSSHLGLMSSTVLWQGLFIQLSCFSCVYISIFKVNSTFLSWCYGLALSGLKSWHLGLKLQVFNRCLWTTRKHKSIHSAFMGSIDITQVLGSLKNPYIDWVEQHKSVFLDGMRQQLEAWSLWNRTWPARFLEDGRISPQLVHLEGKRLLIIQNTLPCAKLEVYRIWRSYQQGHGTSNRSICSHKFN